MKKLTRSDLNEIIRGRDHEIEDLAAALEQANEANKNLISDRDFNSRTYFKMGDDIRKKDAVIKIYEDALNRIASWAEGEKVKANFDEPCSATIAREALCKAMALLKTKKK